MGNNVQNNGLFTGLTDNEMTVSTDDGMLKGYIVKYDPERGYGFVRDDNHDDFYFRIKAFKEKGEPEVGRYVIFRPDARKPKEGQKMSVSELCYDSAKSGKFESGAMKDSREKCPGCGRYIKPYLSTHNGRTASICPHCHLAYNETVYGTNKAFMWDEHCGHYKEQVEKQKHDREARNFLIGSLIGVIALFIFLACQ